MIIMRISKEGKPFGFRKRNRIWVGRKHTSLTKKIMSLCKLGNLNPFYGHCHSKEYIMMMRGNTFCQDWRLAHPVWNPPNFKVCTPHISVPDFVPIINQRISNLSAVNYYNEGIIPRGLSVSALSCL